MAATTKSALRSAWFGREREIDRLWELLEEPDLALPTFVYGPSGGGKSGVLRAVLQALGARHAILDCVTCSTARSLFESALTQLHRHVPSASNGYTGWAPCDSAPAFVAGLQQAVSEYGRLVLVFDNAAGLAERKEVLTLLLSLHTLCGSAVVSIVFVAEALWPEAQELTAFAPLATVRFGGYSKAQLEAILAVDAPKGCEAAWRDFLPLFVSYSYEICRDLHELRYLCRGAFGEWMRPMHDGLIDAGDKGALLRAGKVCLQEARKRVYVREVLSSCTNTAWCANGASSHAPHSQQAPLTRKAEAARAVDGADGGGLALPTSAKWLLLSAYLASRCRPGMDSALFASRQKGRVVERRLPFHTLALTGAPSSRRAKRARAAYDEPHAFTMQRLLAICAALRHAGVGGGQPMAPELTQVASLLRMRLLHRASRAEELDAVRLSCAAPLELVDATARELQFDLEVYLAG